MKRALILIAVIILMASCEGPEGPLGPTGPQGPAGPAGQDFEYFSGSATVKSDGSATIALPVGAGTKNRAPLVNFYIGDGSGTWLSIATDVSPGGAIAGISWQGSRYIAVVMGAPPGWIFWVSAAW